MASLSSSRANNQRIWSDHEMREVVALISKGVHRHRDNPAVFATHLNRAMNGQTAISHLDLVQVAELLHHLFMNNMAAVRFIERQHSARLTNVQLWAYGRLRPDFVKAKVERRVGSKRVWAWHVQEPNTQGAVAADRISGLIIHDG